MKAILKLFGKLNIENFIENCEKINSKEFMNKFFKENKIIIKTLLLLRHYDKF